LREKEES